MVTSDETNTRYILYARKSSESDEKQALSIEAQVKEMKALAERQGLSVADIRRESHSAKAVAQRPVFNSIVEDIRDKKYNGILTWAPDRLSRNAGDLGSLVDLMDQRLLNVISTHGQRFTNTPNEKFLLMILCSQAKLENDQKSKNVQRGLRARCEQGLWPAPAPTGYLNHPDRSMKCHVVLDPHRAPHIRQMFEKVGYEGWSGRKVYYWLKEIGFTGSNGKTFTLSNIYRALKLDFYYGRFEYPKESGNWYTGQHDPIITKSLFDRVQVQLESQTNNNQTSREFAFTRLMTCGSCGSGITAQVKYKKLKNGKVNRYVYYNCTQARNRSCAEKYLRECDLIKQLVELLDDIDVVKSGLQQKLQAEVDRFSKFQAMMGLKMDDIAAKQVQVRQYAKYVLQNGTIQEKREVMECFKSRIVINDKNLFIKSLRS